MERVLVRAGGAAGRALALALATLAACSDPAPPAWIPLAGRFTLENEHATFTRPWRAGRDVEIRSSPASLQLSIPVLAEEWKPESVKGVWRTPMPLYLPKHRRGASFQLLTPEGKVPRAELAPLLEGVKLEGFVLYQRALVFGGQEPPAVATLEVQVSPSAGGGPGRVEGRDFSGEGVLLRHGTTAVCTVDVPPRSALSFATIFEPILVPPGEEGEAVVRVLIDGELVHEIRERFQDPWLPSWHRVALPPAGARGARVALEAQGMLASVAVLDPEIGPADVGTRGARPWGPARPDVVVFLADTFRADNLTAYGGTDAITPNLDALADASLCFTRAWSSATWTLPSHATLFSGYQPFQVQATGETCLLPDGILTVVEMLAHAGYRTAALTDGGFVSGQFGLDQGFALFSETTRRPADKFEEARRFLAADDGRPVFLFVQTYRTHWPYRVDPEVLSEVGERLGIDGDSMQLLKDALQAARDLGNPSARFLHHLTDLRPSPRMSELARALEAHYRGGAASLDHAFAEFLAILRGSGALDDGFLVFTSDHGEAFFEHGGFFHSQQPFEEQTRIPLLVHGARVPARRVDHAVSLLDLAPTLADMAGIAPQPGWTGRSLLDSVSDRPVLSFRARADTDDGFALLAGDKKVMGLTVPDPDRERVLGAFDLTADGAELVDAAAAGAPWPRELLERYASLLEHALDPIVQGETAELDPERAAELKALGY